MLQTMNRFCIIVAVIRCSISDVIWYQKMEGNTPGTTPNAIHWTVNASSLSYEQGSSFGQYDCPNITTDQNDACWALCYGYMFREASTVGFNNIAFEYWIDPWSMYLSHGEYCQILWSANSITWTRIHKQYDSSDDNVHHIAYLHPDTSDVASLYIKVAAVGHLASCCYIAEFKLSGDRIDGFKTTNASIAETELTNASVVITQTRHIEEMESNDDDILIPLLLSLSVVLILIVIAAVLYFRKRTMTQRQTESEMAQHTVRGAETDKKDDIVQKQMDGVAANENGNTLQRTSQMEQQSVTINDKQITTRNDQHEPKLGGVRKSVFDGDE